MKTRRNHSWIAVVAVLGVIAYVLAASSIEQNQKVRKTFDSFFTAIQNQDITRLTKYYMGNEFAPSFYDTLFRYKLYGWKITTIDKQPWPMDTGDWVKVTGEMYFELPDKLVEPAGPYKRVTNAYGPCAVVPLNMRFYFSKEMGWNIMPPHAGYGEDWPFPYESIKNDKKQITPQLAPKEGM